MPSEPELIRLLFTLADVHQWVNELSSAALSYLPHMSKKKLQKADYYLSLPTLVHILERHYHKIQRHPGAGKFCIPMADILGYIRQAKDCEQYKMPNHAGSYRILLCDTIIGFSQDGCSTSYLTVITDSKGNILTAFPGTYQPKETEISKPVFLDDPVGFA